MVLDKITVDLSEVDAVGASQKQSATVTHSDKHVTKRSRKGVEICKKKVRAFSIQKKTSGILLPAMPPKAGINPSGNAVVVIGKLNAVKTTPKTQDNEAEQKIKYPKPPKPGTIKRQLQESYTELQKKTLTEIEDMKRKMELIELGIPLGLICPTQNSVKAMPTKAMPPIKSFIDPAKVDDLIKEAKKAKADGKEFKFDYQKLLPNYDNPFQRKKDELSKAEGTTDSTEKVAESKNSKSRHQHNRSYDRRIDRSTDKDRDVRKYDKHHDSKKHSSNKKDYKEREKEKEVSKKKSKHDKTGRTSEKSSEKCDNEADVNLNDYLVCDSWSLETEEKIETVNREIDLKKDKGTHKKEDNNFHIKEITEQKKIKSTNSKQKVKKKRWSDYSYSPSYKSNNVHIKKFYPIVDTFDYEIDDDDLLNELYDKTEDKKKPTLQEVSPRVLEFRDDLESSSDMYGNKSGNEDTFLESIINEIKQEDLSDNYEIGSQEKNFLVEYDLSPEKQDDDINHNTPEISPSYPPVERRSVTPELDNRFYDLCSEKSNYSDMGYRSTESDHKKSEYGYRSSEGEHISCDSGFQPNKEKCKLVEDKFTKLDIHLESGNQPTEYGKQLTEYGKQLTEFEKPPTKYENQPNEYGRQHREYGRQLLEYGNPPTEYGEQNTEFGKQPFDVEYGIRDDYVAESKLSIGMMECLDTWSFVLKICQPLLFRHDRNKCYRKSVTLPSVWYSQNPKICSCVKDRILVYSELETCKMALVNRVYGCDQIPEAVSITYRKWYPTVNFCLTENSIDLSNNWEADESSQNSESNIINNTNRSTDISTPQLHRDELALDREYQKFMDAVWPEVSQTKIKPNTSSTIVMVNDTVGKNNVDKSSLNRKLDTKDFMGDTNNVAEFDDTKTKKKKKKDRSNKIGEDWSNESDTENNEEKVNKKKVNVKKRKHSPISSNSDSDSSASDVGIDKQKSIHNKKKADAKKSTKKKKRKLQKKRQIEKKTKMKRLKEKLKKKKKVKERERSVEVDSDTNELGKRDNSKSKGKLKDRKIKLEKSKKKEPKNKNAKTRRSSSSVSNNSSDESSESDSSSHSDMKTAIKKLKKSSKDKAIKDDVHSKKRSKNAKKIHKSSSTESDSETEGLFDENVLNNIKKERVSDNEITPTKVLDAQEFSPRLKPKHVQSKEIINMKELQNEFVEKNLVRVKQEIIDYKEFNDSEYAVNIPQQLTVQKDEDSVNSENYQTSSCSAHTNSMNENSVMDRQNLAEYQKNVKASQNENKSATFGKNNIEESNLSQPSSQESVYSMTDISNYEKDDSHLRPSSQNSNYSFRDVITASKTNVYPKNSDNPQTYSSSENLGNFVNADDFDIQPLNDNDYNIPDIDAQYSQFISSYSSEYSDHLENNFHYHTGDSDKAIDQQCDDPTVSRPIETVVTASGNRGEIKCDWRPGTNNNKISTSKPSRWGLKPQEANIVLTEPRLVIPSESQEVYPIRSVLDPVQNMMSSNLLQPSSPPAQKLYRIETISLARPSNNDVSPLAGYDEAYADMYGELDHLQYGDCFAEPTEQEAMEQLNANHRLSLDARIDMVLRDSVLGKVTKEPEEKKVEEQNDEGSPEKGILLNKANIFFPQKKPAVNKRVSFADGYAPGQDSDSEEPPRKKKKTSRRYGCAWPCPASHPDHVPLWDALPPPPPPPGSPPPPPAPASPAIHLLRRTRPSNCDSLPEPPHRVQQKYDLSMSYAGLLQEPPAIGFK